MNRRGEAVRRRKMIPYEHAISSVERAYARSQVLAVRRISIALALAFVALLSGCGELREWHRNGFKVGPNYERPAAYVEQAWIDSDNPRIRTDDANPTSWWTVFQDPILDSLIEDAYRCNLDVKAAGTRILASRAQKKMVTGELMPQSQQAFAAFTHAQISKNLSLPLGPLLNVWPVGFNASWEFDFWGRFRRAIESADAGLDSSFDGYSDVLVLLFSEIAESYVQYRVYQERIRIAHYNVDVQRGSLELAETKFRLGGANELDVQQARSSLKQTESTIPVLETGLRQANNRLCVLLGSTPVDLSMRLGFRPVPTAPAAIAAGAPAELLRRRPDIRRAERDAAAQSAQIGVAKSDLYPRFALFGFVGYISDDFKSLFSAKSFTGIVAPNFQWQIFNYGRLKNNIRTQESRFQEKIYQYQQTVLQAAREVEDAFVAFLKAREQAERLAESVTAAERSVELVTIQYREGSVDFNRVYNLQSSLLAQQDQLALARGNIALQTINAYKALGGGWAPRDPRGEFAPAKSKHHIYNPHHN